MSSVAIHFYQNLIIDVDQTWLQILSCHVAERCTAALGLHRHRDPQWYCCVDGRVRLEVAGLVHRLSPGDHLLVPPWALRRLDPEGPATYLMLRLRSELLRVADWVGRPVRRPTRCGDDLRDLLDRIAKGPPPGDAMVEVLLLRLLLTAQDAMTATAQRLESDVPAAEATLRRVEAYVAGHLGERLDRTALARVACCSAVHLARLCRLHRGCTLQKLVEGSRMRQARQLLLAGRSRVEAIAGRLGYITASHFGAVFRRHHGLTPRAFRASGGRTWWQRQPEDGGPLTADVEPPAVASARAAGRRRG